MQPRRLSRSAGKLCRKHAWNARSKQRHVPDTKQVLLWKGWVLKQRLNDVRSRVGATATRAHVEFPLRTELFVDSCSVRHHAGQLLREHTRNPRHLDLHLHTRHREMFMRQTAVFARHKHTWISIRAQRDMFRRNDCCVLTPRAHLDLFPCAKRHVPSKRLLRSRAAPQDR